MFDLSEEAAIMALYGEELEQIDKELWSAGKGYSEEV